MDTTWKTIKWLIPVIAYIVFVSFLSFMSEIERPVYGLGLWRGPAILSENVLLVKLLPLIPWGYILLFVTQWIHSRQKGGVTLFACLITVVSMILLTVIVLKKTTDYDYFVIFLLIPLVIYYYLFFSILSFMFRLEENDYHLTDACELSDKKCRFLKWLHPVFAYLFSLGLLFFMAQVEQFFYGSSSSTGPLFLSGIDRVIAYLPLIVWGYILLLLTQFLYKKEEVWGKKFAWAVALLSMVVVAGMQREYITDWWYFTLIILSQVGGYYLLFFPGLFYLLRKGREEEYSW